MTDCWNCGSDEHIARNCPKTMPPPDVLPVDNKPRWCGGCDPHTRLIDLGNAAARCPTCHPLAWKPLAQHKKCGGCGGTVYEWDQQPCGSHQPLAGPVFSRSG